MTARARSVAAALVIALVMLARGRAGVSLGAASTFDARAASFAVTFQGEIPSDLKAISALLRNQYSIGYVPTNPRREGKH